MFENFEFGSPFFFFLFFLFIPLIIKDLYKKKRKGIILPSVEGLKKDKRSSAVLFLLKFSKYILLSAIILALARPRTSTVVQDREDARGVDIILTIDVSLSMLAKDLEPDRLEALRDIAKEFVKKRPDDRIGLVTYAAEAISKVPVTFDHEVVLEELDQLDPMELQPGTSIGDGLAVAATHLKESEAKSKIIILMTDGVNTVQNGVPPMVAARLAKDLGIKVYTIGIGTNGYALMPVSLDFFGELMFREAEVSIDEPTLREIAKITGGRYYRATSNKDLKEVYAGIDKLEKTGLKKNMTYHYEEWYRVFLWIAILVLIFDAFVRWIFYKTVL
ncbi:MAG: VWA domain-containing protein [Bergeyella sp.]|nr:VWA domain-containing protein [Bergeyella sp.]